jgi:hypothetical protein
MINKVMIEGEVQKGWKDKPAVESITTQSGKIVSKFNIISKYGPEDKFSSGIVKVTYWQPPIGGPLSEFVNAGDVVMIEGELKTESWESKDGSGKKYQLSINAQTVEKINHDGTQEQTEDPMEAIPTPDEYHGLKESTFKMDDSESVPVNDEQIPF